MKKYVVIVLIVLVAGAVGIHFYKRKPETVTFRTGKVERGAIVSTVSATGNLAAVVTVQVGTQVSGTVQKLFVDFNSRVKKGQAIAQIDPSLFNAQVEQSQGNLANARANLEKARADLLDAGRTLERNRRLVQEGIISQSEFDAAQTRYEQAQAAVKASEGNVRQTLGSATQAQTSLRYATIKSPVDGIIVSRNVDVGQTVAASFQTPTLFTIAQDLTKMRIETSVDEADISRVKEGQPVSFTVDAYPESRFTGKVVQIRNAPVVAQNVVTYVVVVSVENRDMKLKPGMTANVSIETARKDDVLRIPAAALRFRPKAEQEGKDSSEKLKKAGMKKEAVQQVYIPGQDNKPVPAPVKTGISSDGQVELLEGNLKEGDDVIVDQVSPKKKSKGMGGSPMGPRF